MNEERFGAAYKDDGGGKATYGDICIQVFSDKNTT